MPSTHVRVWCRVRLSLKRGIHAVSIFIALCPCHISYNMSNVSVFFWSYILKECTGNSILKKELDNRFLVFTSSIKSEIRNFHIIVVQQRQRNEQISVMFVQNCCFAHPNLFLCRSHCCHCCLGSFEPPSSCLKRSLSESLSSVDPDDSERNFIPGFVPDIQRLAKLSRRSWKLWPNYPGKRRGSMWRCC